MNLTWILGFGDVQTGSHPFPRVSEQIGHHVWNRPVLAELRFGLKQEAGSDFVAHEIVIYLCHHGLHVGFGYGQN